MKVSELKELVAKGEEPDIKIEKYLPITVISIMVNDIADACVKVNEDGMAYCNFVSKKLNTDVSFLTQFASIEFDDKNDLEGYDWLWANGIVKKVYDAIDKDYVDMIKELIDNEVNQRIALINSVEASVAKGVRAFVNAIDVIIKRLPSTTQINNLIKKASAELKDFNPEKLNVLGDIIKEVK
jgi:hypothetical protein